MKNLLLVACFMFSVTSLYANFTLTKFSNPAFCSAYPSVYSAGSFSVNEITNTGVKGFTKGQTNTTLIIGFSNAAFQFNPGVGTVTATGTEVTIVSYSITSSAITVTLSTLATNTQLNSINFNNIQVRATAAATGYIKRSGGTFKVDNKTSNPTATTSWGDLTAGTPLAYSSASAVQPVISPVYTGSIDNQVIGVQVTVTGTCSVVTATSFNFNTTGSTAPATDIASAQLYYTGTNNIFSNATLFGSVTNPNGAFSISGNQSLSLSAGTYYFWLTYSISSGATNTNIIDAQFLSSVIAGNTYTAASGNPTGSRTISNNIFYSIAAGNWSSTSLWSRTQGGASCACAPTAGNGLVYVNHAVSLDNSYTVDNVTIQNGGNLTNAALRILTVSNTVATTGSGIFAATTTWVLNNLATAGTGTSSAASATTITGSLNIGAATTYQLTGGAALTVNGNITVSGTLALGASNVTSSNAAGTLINGTGSITGSGIITIGVNKSFPLGTALTISPVINITNGTTLINYGTVTMQNNITGGGVNATWVNGVNGVLNMNGATTSLLSTGALDAAAVPNTVNYGGSGNQTVKVPSASYYNLYVASSASGIKSLAAAITVNNDIQLSSGAQLNAGAFAITINGNWINNSTHTTPFSSSGTVNFNGTDAISGTAITSFNNIAITVTGLLTANSLSGKVIILGNWTNDGVFDHNSSDIIFNGTTTISGATVSDFNTVIVNASKTLTLAAVEMEVDADLTVNGTLNHNNGLLIFDGTGIVQNINGAGAALTLYQCEIINPSGSVVLARPLIINNLLTLTVGNLILGSNNLTLATSVPAIAGSPFSAANMIVASGSGSVIKNGTSAASASYTFPVGDNIATAEYSPLTLTFSTGTYTSGSASVRATNAKHPDNTNGSSFINRYWTVSTTGYTVTGATVAAIYTDADITGTESNILMGRWTGALPWITYSASLNSATNTLTSPSISSFGDFTGMENYQQWTGAVSTDWSVAGNWDNGVVPTASINVVIPSGAVRMPSLISSSSCNSIIINAGAVVTNTNAGTLNIAGTFNNNGTYTDNGTTIFNGSTGQQTFSGITIFNNLTLNNTTSLLLPAAITINGNLLITAGTLIANDFNISVKGNWTNNVSSGAFTAGNGTVTFNGNSAKAIGGTASTTFNNCTISNTGSTVTLNVNSIISGNLSVSAGTFDLGSFTANRATAGGILTVSNNAFLKIGGTNSYPANYTANTLAAASTVEYSGTAQTVAAWVYGNLKLSSASGAVVKTFPSVALTIAGNLVSITGPGSDVSFTAAGNISINGNVLIGAGTTFNGGSYTHSIGGNWDNSGTYNGNTGTIILTGTGTTAGGSGIQNFNNLTVAASLISFTNSSISISGNLATTVPGSFSQASGGTFTMTGSGKTISGSGIAVDNLTISGSVSTTPSFTIAGNLTVSGGLTSTAGTITMSGAAKTISGPGTSSIYILSVTGSVTTVVDFTITAGLTVNGSFAASAGTTTFTGAAAFSGTAGLFNVVINGTQLQLSANSILGIANTFTITAGTLDVTSFVPNTVSFNGTGAQIINAINYNNLTLSNGGSKTAAATITINNSITIESGTSVTVSGATLKIAGAINNAGSFDVSAGTIEMNGASSQVIPASVFDGNSISNLIISNDVTLQGPLSVSNTLSFGSSNNILSTGDYLTLKSDAGGTARLADITNGGTESGNTVSGKVTIERYIPGRKSWRLLSVPVSAAGAPSINEAWQEAVVSGNPSPGYGTQITGGTNANGFDLGVNTNPSILVYSNGSNSLPGLPNVPGTNVPITDYPGYFLFVRGNRSTNLSLGSTAPVSNTTLRIKGNLNMNDINMNVNAQNSTLAGNPYPSAIDFHSLTKNNVKDKVYIWDPKIAGTRGVGGYVTLIWNGSSYDATSSVSPVSRYIPSGEAFFVESADGTNPGILTFKEADKTSSGSDNLFRPVYNSEKLRIDLLAVDAAGAASLSDGTLTAYGDNYSNKVDANDASKYSNIGENISILRENNKLSVERRRTIEGPDTTFLNIYNLNKQTYQLQVTIEGMGNAGLYAVLKDKYSSAINNTPLTMGGVSNISFTINSDAASYDRNRFSVVFAKQSLLPVTFTSVQARQQQNDIVVGWNTATETNVKNYEVQTSSNGNQYTGISTVTAIGNNGGNAAYSFVDSNASGGLHYYRIRATSFSGRENYSEMVKVNVVKNRGEITVYPNPVTNGQIKLQLNNMQAGQYHIQILDMLGQVKMSEVFNHNGGSAVKKMQIAKDASKGIYTLEILKPGNSKTAISIMNQ